MEIITLGKPALRLSDHLCAEGGDALFWHRRATIWLLLCFPYYQQGDKVEASINDVPEITSSTF
jgi:hypothetical protein